MLRAPLHVLLPGPRKKLRALAQESERQIVLRGIVTIEGHFRHAGLRADGVDPDAPDAMTREQAVGSLVYAPAHGLAAGGGRFASWGTTARHDAAIVSRSPP